MLLTHFIWQTVLKPLSGTNAKNGAITPSLTPTMQARCYNAGKWVRATWRGITNLSKHVGALWVLYLGIPSACACACACACDGDLVDDLSGKTADGGSRPCGGSGGERIHDTTRQGVLDTV